MKKKFDAVKYQRKVREELSRQYSKDKTVALSKLKKYSILKHDEIKKERPHAR